MPSVSKAQRGFMGAEMGRMKAGEKTKTGMSHEQLKDFQHMKPGAPARVKGKKRHAAFGD
jgi:hypothetical protein